jgi:RNA polymerase sigma factor (sigma-70 family)
MLWMAAACGNEQDRRQWDPSHNTLPRLGVARTFTEGSTVAGLDPPRKQDDGPPWAVELQVRARRLRDAATRDASRERRGFWNLLHSSLLAMLSVQRRRLGWVNDEDLLDIAAEKGADLLARFESGRWTLVEAAPWECRGFLSTVARNGLIDWLRRNRNQVIRGDDADTMLADQPDASMAAQTSLAADRSHFVKALMDCLRKVNARDRRIWVLRVVHDLSTRQIAAHPDVLLKRGHVDVILYRCRESLRACLHGRDIEPGDLPAGVFTELWLQLQDGKEDDHA